MDLFEVVEKRRSVRKFRHEPVAGAHLRRILEAGRLAPSGGNRQPWSFIVVRDLETKKALSASNKVANNQRSLVDADTVIVALSNPEAGGISDQEYLRSTRFSSVRTPYRQDPMIAIEHMVLAATALGYGTCWIGAFNDDEAKKILKIPENLAVIALLPVGVPDESPPQRPRKAFKELFFKEFYGIPLEL